jgi:hypothetical protein
LEITGNPSLQEMLDEFNAIETIPEGTRRTFNDAACNCEKLLVLAGAGTVLAAAGSILAATAGKPLICVGGVALTIAFGAAARYGKKGFDHTVGIIRSSIREHRLSR